MRAATNKAPTTSTVPASATPIWTSSATVGGQDEINSEDDLTPSGDVVIVRSPNSSYVVDTVLLYHKVCIFILRKGMSRVLTH
jgi:hypothetical protein